jgi:hypothetical protein
VIDYGKLQRRTRREQYPLSRGLHVWDEVPERFHEIIRKEYVVLQEGD